MSFNTIRLSVIIPCLNEEAVIPLIYDKINAVLSVPENGGTDEFIFVDDGSTDGTLPVLREYSDKNRCVHYISFSRNFGKEAALLAGLRAARGQYVVILDADGQDPPDLIPRMLDAVSSGAYDCASTRRVSRDGEPPIRSWFAGIFYTLMKKFSDIEIVHGARDFRLMNRTYVDAILSMPERSRFSKGIFPWVGFKTKCFEYENRARIAGETKWSFWKLFLYSLEGIVAFSVKPLAIASVCGIALFLLSMVFTALTVIRKLVMRLPDSGWSSTICVILFTSGIQLFTTGILGTYLAKTHTEVKQRPHYVIREER
jgi:glycosyltransferase involved in cell wall biosynthesis